MKKGAALLMTLLIISAVATFAFTAARSIISSITRTTKSTDSIAALEAANGGIDWGLLKYKQSPVPIDWGPCILDLKTSICILESTKLSSGVYAKVNVHKQSEDSGLFSGYVISIGQAGSAYRTLKATISEAGDVTIDENDACIPTDIAKALICSTQTRDDSHTSSEVDNCILKWSPSGQNLPGEDSRAGRGAKDPRTGLIWSKPLINNAGTIQFSDTFTDTNGLWSWNGYAENNVAVGGKTAAQICSERGFGWRLPSQKEAHQAYIDGASWNLTNADQNFWANTYGSGVDNAWFFRSSDGYAYYEPLNNTGNLPHIRCVADSTPEAIPPRIGFCPTQAASDYLQSIGSTEVKNCSLKWIPTCPVVTGDDARTGRGGIDPRTGLTWSKPLKNNTGTVEFADSAASKWTWNSSGANNIAVGGKTASQLCSERGSGWRLPTQKEALQAYIDGAWWNLSNLTSNTDHWTSSENDALTAWIVTLYMGDSFARQKNSLYFVRCVR